MKESEIEKYLRERVEELSGKAYKFISPGNSGVPDRMICLPKGRIYFVELKTSGKSPRPLQLLQIKQLCELGFSVYVIDSKEKVDKLIEELTR